MPIYIDVCIYKYIVTIVARIASWEKWGAHFVHKLRCRVSTMKGGRRGYLRGR
jgi:hypothetical protein